MAFPPQGAPRFPHWSHAALHLLPPLYPLSPTLLPYPRSSPPLQDDGTLPSVFEAADAEEAAGHAPHCLCAPLHWDGLIEAGREYATQEVLLENWDHGGRFFAEMAGRSDMCGGTSFKKKKVP